MSTTAIKPRVESVTLHRDVVSPNFSLGRKHKMKRWPCDFEIGSIVGSVEVADCADKHPSGCFRCPQSCPGDR